MHIEKNKLKRAAFDLRFLLNRGYRKKGALQFVANKYVLNKDERNYLARSIFSDLILKKRQEKIIDISKIKDVLLLVDGYNVLITVESLYHEDYDSIILCDDMVIRDLNAVFGKYKLNNATEMALNKILDLISSYGPSYTCFFFDSPVSFSGKLAGLTKKIMDGYDLPGNVCLSKTVDTEIIKLSKLKNAIVATGDSVIIDKVDRVVDIPRYILELNRDNLNWTCRNL
ncbi:MULTISPECIES: DUF434 domain-containing protein [Methanobacterium]|uniref:DUF434 domain-containing protein n=1 Tax=Methanobacterium bryantii TaxID=2161 RepID=A0A2A2H296_METBR|nr:MULTISPECIES: DUF434 domain-containing protein [Methanobacterium]OEC88084.1 hypothetical protein A9507_05860 [Methanobacterium sp. A39]PAV03485.1 hypothetical protein ASJ80_00590 [Methanobacterium bryantii]